MLTQMPCVLLATLEELQHSKGTQPAIYFKLSRNTKITAGLCVQPAPPIAKRQPGPTFLSGEQAQAGAPTVQSPGWLQAGLRVYVQEEELASTPVHVLNRLFLIPLYPSEVKTDPRGLSCFSRFSDIHHETG